MSSGKYEFLSQKLLNQIFGGTAYTFPTTLYLALFSVTPTVSTTGTEATGTSYARVAIVCNTTNWPAISGSTTTISNGVAFTFPTAGGNWSSGSNMSGAGFFDASSSGNLLYWGDLTVPKPVFSGDTASFAVGAATCQEL
jgi:hypothetical protein